MRDRHSSGLNRRDFLRASAVAGGGIFFLGLSGCGNDSAGGQGTTGGQGSGGGTKGYSGDAAITGLTNLIHSAPFFIAELEGYYKAEGLNLKHVAFPGGLDTVRGIDSGIGLGSPATLPVFIAAEKGLKVRVISNIYSLPSVDYIAPTASPINRLEDLGGKKLGVSTPGSNSTYFAERSLRAAGLEPGKDVELVSLGGASDAWTAASQGVVDAAWTASPLSDKLVAGKEARVIGRSRDYVQQWSDTCLAATEDFIDKNGDALRAWVRAVQRGMDLIKNDLPRAAEIYGKAIQYDPAVAMAALKGSQEAYRTRLEDAELKAVVDAGLEQKQLTRAPGLDDVVKRGFTA